MKKLGIKKINKKVIFIFLILIALFIFSPSVYADSLDCEAWGDVRQDFQNIFDFCKIVIPLLIIGFSAYDFIKAITNKDDKGVKKAFTKLMKRLVYAVIFYFLPVILNFVLELAETNSNVCIE